MGEQSTNKQTISLKNRISDCSKLSDFLTSYANAFNISEDVYNDLRLVLEETFINIASYAFDIKDSENITIELDGNADKISITFTDTGIAFDPLTDAEDYGESDDHCEGGMGIHIIKSLSDHQEYNRVGQSNVFTVTKHYTK